MADHTGYLTMVYYETINWAPIMGGTSSNVDYQWNNGDYDEANNLEQN